MVGHQTPSQNLYLPFIAILPQPFQINLPVFIFKKDIFSAVSSLGNVVGDIGEYASG